MLINCVAYQDGKKLAEIGKREISAYLSRPDCFVWVALRDADEAELHEMQEEFGLHELVGEELSVGELDVFIGPNYVLSVRNNAPKGFQDVRARCEREPELLRYGSGYVLYALMDAVVDRYFPALDALETKLERIEEEIFGGHLARANIESLYALKQNLMTLKHAAGPLLDAVGKLYGGRVPHACAGMAEYFRDVNDHLVRLNSTIDSIRDMVSTAMNVNVSLISLQENEVTKRLAAYAALVAVPTLIAGIYGMNFKAMPELQWSFGYPLALGAMAIIDGYFWYRFRKARWL
jgi:magnesium transporter